LRTAEVLAIIDAQPAELGEAQIGLVHQRGGIEQSIAAAFSQSCARHGTQFV
jgi:hypothetical protein